MRHIRTSVEWPYEMATNLFHILQSKYLKRLLRHNHVPNDIVCKQLQVVFFFYNCYVYGSKFSRFFGLIPLKLEDYLANL
jgi:hypothetical protein